ncbi:MAG: Asp23/Gls24 family envelope stress response protein [Gracilibacteraceae bacterium]|nr:Asp23/Gls24 family envelope stress response protein [Gracilibacteraceae bacterium]
MELPRKEDGIGAIRIVDEVVEIIAAMAASEVEGVAGASGLASDIAHMFNLSKAGAKGKGVKVELNEQEAKVDLYLAVEYGHSLVAVAEKVQMAVKNALEIMTGLLTKEVNVHVQGIIFKQAETKDSAQG